MSDLEITNKGVELLNRIEALKHNQRIEYRKLQLANKNNCNGAVDNCMAAMLYIDFHIKHNQRLLNEVLDCITIQFTDAN